VINIKSRNISTLDNYITNRRIHLKSDVIGIVAESLGYKSVKFRQAIDDSED